MPEGTRNDRDERVVYCREIDPDTVLHLTVDGERYMFRRFDGTDPFLREDAPDYDEMRVCYRFAYDRPLDETEASHPAGDEAWWRQHFEQLNRELIGDLRGM